MYKTMTYLILALSVTGCALGKDYARPQIILPEKYLYSEKDAVDVVDTEWWKLFKDENLNSLIEEGIKNNLDVRMAQARVEQYLGKYGITRSNLFPQIGASANAAQQRVSERGINAPAPGMDPKFELYNASLGISSWELDIWGKLRRATEAAKADMLSQEEYKRAMLLSVASRVASGYINLVNLKRQLVITRQTARSREISHDIFKARFDAGYVSEMELNQAKSEYESAMAMIPQLENAIAVQENAMCVLLGRNPGKIMTAVVNEDFELPSISVPAGLPSELLERRPDIRQAEEMLRSANANIWVAKAQYFPSISLTGLFGVSSTDLTRLFTGPANTWSYMGQVTAPIFTAGRIAGQVKAAEAYQKEALANYTQTIQKAFADAENSLVTHQKTREKAFAQKRQVEALKKYRELANLQYDNGYTDYTTVLDAERNLFNIELTYVQTLNDEITSIVNIYSAMGGGWREAEDILNQPSEKSQLFRK